MQSEEERCAEHRKLLKIEEAFRAGDLNALRAAVDDPAAIPNGPMPLVIGTCLVFAIYWSPLRFIRELLEIGADPNLSDGDGFPPLIAAIVTGRSEPVSNTRTDVKEIVAMLLEFGADPNQRGIDDYTPLHMAVAERNLSVLELLLASGADPRLRTRIDDYETPREMAVAIGRRDFAELLESAERRRG